MRRSRLRGFTLIELVITVGVILILAGAVFAAVDPLKRVAQARNARRLQDSEALASAMLDRGVRNLPVSVDTDPATWQMLGIALFGCDRACDDVTTESACLDLSSEMVSGGQLSAMPFDPDIDVSGGVTGYAANRIGGSFVVRACLAEPDGPRGSGDAPLLEVAR